MRDWIKRYFHHSPKAYRSHRTIRSNRPVGMESVIQHRKGRSGQSLIIIAVAFMGIIAFIGFAVDTGIMYLHRIWLGQAIDAAALASGYELPDIEGACSRAVEYLHANGYTESDEFTYQIIFTADENAPGGPVGEFVIDSDIDNILQPEDCTSVSVPSEHDMTHYHVRIAGELTIPVVFMRVLGFETIQVGTPATAKRTAQYDVALILDVSGSMLFDSCNWLTDEPEYTEPYACENVWGECSAPISEVTFNGYTDIDAMIADGWVINSTDAVEFQPVGGHDGAGVHIYQDAATNAEGSLSWDWNVTIPEDEKIAVYFWVKNDPFYTMDYSDYGDQDFVRVAWRTDPADGWNYVMGIPGGSTFDTDWEQYAVVLDTDQIDDYLELRWYVQSVEDDEGYILDDIQLRTCPNKRGPFLQYSGGCNSSKPRTCASEAPDSMFPGQSVGSYSAPRPYMLQQPMTDVIRGAETFINIIKQRADDSGMPREDQIGLGHFQRYADQDLGLTIDYENIIETMYTDTDFRANGYTNLSGGMRVGLGILADGRPNTTHFMILLTDGVLNRYDQPCDGSGGSPAFGLSCSPSTCVTCVDELIADAQVQNVTIFTIGLGYDVVTDEFTAYGDSHYTGMKLMDRIAHLTNGQSYFAPTSEELEEIFEWIADAIFVRLTL